MYRSQSSFTIAVNEDAAVSWNTTRQVAGLEKRFFQISMAGTARQASPSEEKRGKGRDANIKPGKSAPRGPPVRECTIY